MHFTSNVSSNTDDGMSKNILKYKFLIKECYPDFRKSNHYEIGSKYSVGNYRMLNLFSDFYKVGENDIKQ